MKNDNEPSHALQSQLAQLGSLSQQQLKTAEQALEQTQDILLRAIAELNASFLGLHALIQAADETHQQQGAAGSNIESGSTVVQTAAEHVGRAVTALQFQDISSQLLTDSQRRIAGVRQLLEAALPGVNVHDAQRDISCLRQAIENALVQQGKDLGSLGIAPIASGNGDQGAIELF